MILNKNCGDDPILAMLGVGRQQFPGPAESLPGAAWLRVVAQQGKQFQTARGLPFTFEVEGTGIWFFRDGKRINRKLTRKQFEVALSRCPLKRTTEIKDLMDYPYLFAILKDASGPGHGDRMARVFWDTNLFIYLFEKNAGWSPRVIEPRRTMLARRDDLLTLERSYINFLSGGSVDLVAFGASSGYRTEPSVARRNFFQ